MKKIFELYLLLSRGKQIAVAVLLIHLLILLSLTFHHLNTSRLRPPRPMVVKTITAEPLKTKPIAKAAPQASLAKPKAAPPATKLAKAPSSSIKQATNSSSLKEIAASFDIIAKEPKNKAPTPLQIPTKISPPQKREEEKEDPTYSEYLVAFLQNALDLPEYGEVRLKLEIDSFGALVDCQILDSKSPKNASFLKEEIAHLSFPIPHLSPFEKTKTFTITFKNQ